MNHTKPLSRNFYNRDTLVVSTELLGKFLVSRTPDGDIMGKIVEVEAYKGSDDPASHAYKGETARNRLMFGKPGFAYVYFIYGNHYCMNVTTEPQDVPGAVLIRAVEIVRGIELARKNRTAASLVSLSNGPGKLTKALNISKTHNGVDLTSPNELFISAPKVIQSFDVAVSRRVGVRAGGEKLWRFFIRNNKFISKL